MRWIGLFVPLLLAPPQAGHGAELRLDPNQIYMAGHVFTMDRACAGRTAASAPDAWRACVLASAVTPVPALSADKVVFATSLACPADAREGTLELLAEDRERIGVRIRVAYAAGAWTHISMEGRPPGTLSYVDLLTVDPPPSKEKQQAALEIATLRDTLLARVCGASEEARKAYYAVLVANKAMLDR